MSTENLTKFAEAAAANPALQAKIQAIHAQAARDTAEQLAALSAGAGAPFTAEEFLTASRLSASLSEEDLERVAGGAWEPSASNIVLSLLTVGIACGGAAIASAAQGNVDNCQLKSGYLK